MTPTPKTPTKKGNRPNRRKSTSGKKHRNKVSATKPNKTNVSPIPIKKLSFADEDDDLATVTSNRSKSSTRSLNSRDKIPHGLVVDLCKHIESNGGLELFTNEYATKHQVLSKSLDRDIETFGKRGDPIRKRLTRRVSDWKNLLEKGEYTSKVLIPYGVTAWGQRQFEKKKHLNTPVEPTENDNSSTSSLSESDDDEAPATPPPVPKEVSVSTNSTRRAKDTRKPAPAPIVDIPDSKPAPAPKVDIPVDSKPIPNEAQFVQPVAKKPTNIMGDEESTHSF